MAMIKKLPFRPDIQNIELNNVDACLTVLGDKWTALILTQLTTGPLPFSKLETTLKGISPRTLSSRLDKLIQANVIEKSLYCKHPPRYIYHLSKKGRELINILRLMAEFGAEYS